MRVLMLACVLVLTTRFSLLVDVVMCQENTAESRWNQRFVTLLAGMPEARDVRVVDANPLGVDRRDHANLHAIGAAIARHYTRYENRRTEPPNEVRILAWSVKAHTRDLPPELTDEVVVLLRWEQAHLWSLCYLYRRVLESNPLYIGWQNNADITLAGLPWQEQFSTEPTEARIVEFVRKTNFGNNEMTPDVLVASVFLYDKSMHVLREELSKGVHRNEKASRYNRVTRASAHRLIEVPRQEQGNKPQADEGSGRANRK
jgi:hypothetical protein